MLPAQQRAAAAGLAPAPVDLTPWICPAPSCPVAIGHVTVHRAGDHLTATYVRTLAPRLARCWTAAPGAVGETEPAAIAGIWEMARLR